jgi:hypothetical protein
MATHPLVYQEFVLKDDLAPYEADLLRSAVLQLTHFNDLLYHNHLKDGFRYGYPLIQYKSILGKAAILYLGEGIGSIHKLFNTPGRHIKIKDKDFYLNIEKIHAQLYTLQVTEHKRYYDIINWLPLQDKNYLIYRELKNAGEKEDFLKKLLIGNILTFAKGVGWHIDHQITIEDMQIYKEKWVSFKGQKFKTFNIRFSTGVFLPPHIGLGKGAAHNYGVLFPVRKNKTKETKTHIE